MWENLLNFLTVLILSAASGALFTGFSPLADSTEGQVRRVLAPAILAAALGVLQPAVSRRPVLFAGPLAVSRQNTEAAFWFLAAALFLLLLAFWFAKHAESGILQRTLPKLRFYTALLSVLILLCAVPGLGLVPSLLFLFLPGLAFSRFSSGIGTVFWAACAGAASWLVSLPLRLPASVLPEGLPLPLSLLAVSAAAELVFRRRQTAEKQS